MNIHDLQVNATARQQDIERAFRASSTAGSLQRPRLLAFIRRGRPAVAVSSARAPFRGMEPQPGN